MDNLQQNQQQRFVVLDELYAMDVSDRWNNSGATPKWAAQHAAQHPLFPSMARPTNSGESDMASEEHLIYWNSPSPSSYSMVFYQGSGQSSTDNLQQNQQQRPTNSGESDMATEDFDVMSFLNPPRSPSPSDSMVLDGQSYMDNQLRHQHQHQDYVDRPRPYIAQDRASFRYKLVKSWSNESDNWEPRAGIMLMYKYNEELPQSPERQDISLMSVYVEDRLDTLLYWRGESWTKVYMYMERVSKLFPWEEQVVKSDGNGLLATATSARITMLKEAAEHLKVGKSTMKRTCRKHGINRWQPCNKYKGVTHSLPNETPAVVNQEGIPQGERATNKSTGVRIDITLEEILRCGGMCRKDAATQLKVSESTLKRICRRSNISRWPPRRVDEHINQSLPNKSPSVVDQEQICQLNFATVLRSNQASIETNSVTIKAKYETLKIKFRLSRPWRKVELEEQVKMRLQLEVGTYHTEYKDEDGELILIGCDEDLKDCIPNSSPMGTCSIELFLRQSSS